MGYRDNFELKEGTGFQAILMAAPAIYAGAMAANAKMQYGKEVNKIEGLLENRQNITNPYKDLENPYKNLPVATQAARFQAENADIALANTLDTLRATGAAAGGATALAQAALQSQQGISASLEKQEAQNARLRAQGQLQVDAAKAKGETFRMRMQEARDVRDINRIQRQADIFKATQIANQRAMFDQFGSALETLSGGVVPKQKEDLSKSTRGNQRGVGIDAARFDAGVSDDFGKSKAGDIVPMAKDVITNKQGVQYDAENLVIGDLSKENRISAMAIDEGQIPTLQPFGPQNIVGSSYAGVPSLTAPAYQPPPVNTNFMPRTMEQRINYGIPTNPFNNPIDALTGGIIGPYGVTPTGLRLTTNP